MNKSMHSNIIRYRELLNVVYTEWKYEYVIIEGIRYNKQNIKYNVDLGSDGGELKLKDPFTKTAEHWMCVKWSNLIEDNYVTVTALWLDGRSWVTDRGQDEGSRMCCTVIAIQ